MLRNELVAKMKSLHAKMSEAKGDELASMVKDFDALNSEVGRIDLVAARDREEAQISAQSKAEMADRELWQAFGSMLRGEAVGDVARDALKPRSTVMRDKAGPTAFRAPGDASAYFAARTTTPTTSTTSQTSTSTTTPVPPTFPITSGDLEPLLLVNNVGATVMLPFPPTPMFNAATKVAAINGIAYPILNQTAADPFAGVHIWKGRTEGEEKGKSAPPEVNPLTIATHEKNAQLVITDLALRRAPSYENIISAVFRNAIAYQVNHDILDGDGITESLGIITDPGVLNVTRTGPGAIEWADLVGLKYAAPYFWTDGARFTLSQSAIASLEATATAPAPPMFTGSTAAGIYSRLAGKDYFIDGLPALGTAGDVIFGDPRWYTLAIEQDIVFRRTNEGWTLASENSTAFFVFCHIGGRLLVPSVYAKLV